MNERELLWRIGSAVRERRVELGLSQEKFADSIGMHRAYYGQIERGKKNLTISTLSRVTQGLAITLRQLFQAADL
ncbi:TPA: helix-turn-helix transcriptional regulator [Stenotrophomonas maltophilia]|nr:helix-turn-helix transcriptional regulator [Stenotrophomonas maltophilia]